MPWTLNTLDLYDMKRDLEENHVLWDNLGVRVLSEYYDHYKHLALSLQNDHQDPDSVWISDS